MTNQVGKVDRMLAGDQWESLCQALVGLGRSVHIVQAMESREDMVFCANPVFAGTGAGGQKICLLSNMKHPSRQKEVPALEKWFASREYRIKKLRNPNWLFEGHGDALWHPGHRLIWGGFGFRSVPEVYEEVSKIFSASVALLELRREHFFCLDTCLCPLTESEVLYFPGAFSDAGKDLIEAVFPTRIEVPEEEAVNGLVCSALPLGRQVLLQAGNEKTNQALRQADFKPIEIDLSEFIKSGGGVCSLSLRAF